MRRRAHQSKQIVTPAIARAAITISKEEWPSIKCNAHHGVAPHQSL